MIYGSTQEECKMATTSTMKRWDESTRAWIPVTSVTSIVATGGGGQTSTFISGELTLEIINISKFVEVEIGYIQKGSVI